MLLAIAAQERAMHSAAERWGRHAAKVGDAEGDTALAVHGRMIAGRAHMDRGNASAAAQMFRRALDTVQANEAACHDLRGHVFHHLYTALEWIGAHASADLFHDRAARTYGPEHPRAIGLAADRGAGLVLRGDYIGAVAVLEPLVGRRSGIPLCDITAAAHLAVGLAHAGTRVAARGAVSDVRLRLEVMGDVVGTGWAALCLARALSALGEGHAARRAAEDAARRGRRDGEAATVRAARAILRGG